MGKKLSRQEIIDILNDGKGVSFECIDTPKLLFDVLKFSGFSGILMNPLDECYYKMDSITPDICEKYLISYKSKPKMHRGKNINIYYTYSDDESDIKKFIDSGYNEINAPLGYILNGCDLFDEFAGKCMYGFGIISYELIK